MPVNYTSGSRALLLRPMFKLSTLMTSFLRSNSISIGISAIQVDPCILTGKGWTNLHLGPAAMKRNLNMATNILGAIEGEVEECR